MARGTKVCTECWRIMPCEVHTRKRSSWSTDRDRYQQAQFRKKVLQRDGYSCRRCGHHDSTGRTLVAHHDRPGMDASCGRTLCNSKAPNNCHRAVDANAR